jgi:hypothetical protein
MLYQDGNDPIVVDFETVEAVTYWKSVMDDIRHEAISIAECYPTERSRTVEYRNAAYRWLMMVADAEKKGMVITPSILRVRINVRSRLGLK